jgi:hypothetical protein
MVEVVLEEIEANPAFLGTGAGADECGIDGREDRLAKSFLASSMAASSGA